MPQTLSSSRSRERTMPGCASRYARRSNSLPVSSTGSPATVTSRPSGSRMMSPSSRGVDGADAAAASLQLDQRLLAGPHPGDAVAVLLEIQAHKRADRILVLDQQ